VEDLLQRTETTVASTIQKLRQTGPSSSSRPGTPSQPRSLSHQTGCSRQASPVPPATRTTAQPASALPTPPVSKGKQKAPVFQPSSSTLYTVYPVATSSQPPAAPTPV
jgi:hypothetical protein